MISSRNLVKLKILLTPRKTRFTCFFWERESKILAARSSWVPKRGPVRAAGGSDAGREPLSFAAPYSCLAVSTRAHLGGAQ